MYLPLSALGNVVKPITDIRQDLTLETRPRTHQEGEYLHRGYALGTESGWVPLPLLFCICGVWDIQVLCKAEDGVGITGPLRIRPAEVGKEAVG